MPAPVLATIRLLKVVTTPPKVWAAAPLNVTVPVPRLKVPLCVALPPIFRFPAAVLVKMPVALLVKTPLALTVPVVVSVMVPLLLSVPPTVIFPVLLTVMVSAAALVRFPVMLSAPVETVVLARFVALVLLKVAAALVTLKVPTPTETTSPLATPAAPFTVILPPAAVMDAVEDVATVELMINPPLMVMRPELTESSASRVAAVPPFRVTLPPTVSVPVRTVIPLVTAPVGRFTTTLLVTARLDPAANVNVEAFAPVLMVTELAAIPALLTVTVVLLMMVTVSAAVGPPATLHGAAQVPAALQLPVATLVQAAALAFVAPSSNPARDRNSANDLASLLRNRSITPSNTRWVCPYAALKRGQQVLHFDPALLGQRGVLNPHLDKKFPHLFGLCQTAEHQMFRDYRA